LRYKNSADVAVVQALLSACPDVAQRACSGTCRPKAQDYQEQNSDEKDDCEGEDGNHTDAKLPLHLALSNIAAKEVVILLEVGAGSAPGCYQRG